MTAIIMIITNHHCDHSQVLAGSGDATTTLWDVESGTVLQTFHGHVSGGGVTIINITIRLEICQKIYTTGFWGQKFYTLRETA